MLSPRPWLYPHYPFHYPFHYPSHYPSHCPLLQSLLLQSLRLQSLPGPPPCSCLQVTAVALWKPALRNAKAPSPFTGARHSVVAGCRPSGDERGTL